MGFLKDLKKSLAGDPDLSKLTPAQRAKIEANQARVQSALAEADVQRSREAEELEMFQQELDDRRVLLGPAGGDQTRARVATNDEIRESIDKGPAHMLRQQLSLSKRQLGEVADDLTRRHFDPGVLDPAAWQEIAAKEHAARETALLAYLDDSSEGSTSAPIRISRLATRGATQIDEVAAYLASSGLAARPDLVFGLYRVPDRISPALTPNSERGRVVEWDIVHAVDPGLAACGLPRVSFIDAKRLVTRRRLGEPEPLDEDVAISSLGVAGIGADRCLGISRAVDVRAPSAEFSALRAEVAGVYAFTPGDPGMPTPPTEVVDVAIGDPPGCHVAVLNWHAIARVVQPRLQHPPIAPSPFPYLPLTPQELLLMYVRVVGLRAIDTFAAAVTVNQPTDLEPQDFIAGRFEIDFGLDSPKLPCADGKARTRLFGATQIVIAYRDRIDYQAGRDRWDRYQRDVLQARLHLGTGARRPVAADTFASGAIGTFERAVRKVDIFQEDRTNPHRYCWPPIDLR